jgi:hypothetical protein
LSRLAIRRRLADAIVHLLKNPQLAAHLGRAARVRIADHFSVRRMVRATEDLYTDLLERKRRQNDFRPPHADDIAAGVRDSGLGIRFGYGSHRRWPNPGSRIPHRG